jgi:hypothetical protein
VDLELDVDARRSPDRCCRRVNSRLELDLAVDRLPDFFDAGLGNVQLDVFLSSFVGLFSFSGVAYFFGSGCGRGPVDLELDVDGTERGSRQLLPAPGVRMQLGMELDVDGRSRIRHG